MASFNAAWFKNFHLRVESGARRKPANPRARHRLGLLFLMLPVSAFAIAQSLRFDIPEQPLPTALKVFADQAKIQLLYRHDAVKGATGNAVVGDFDTRDALQILLKDTGLEVVYSRDNAATIRPMQTASKPTASVPRASDYARLAQADASDSSPSSTSDLSSTRDEEPPSLKDRIALEEIVVTGTSLRGVAPESSPVIVYTRKDIEASGHSSLEQFMRTVPQNFQAGANPENYNIFGTGAIFAGEHGAGVNLRGLGQRATLVLINGRRQAPGGVSGSFVDVSLIPLSAIERIEILTNGASAIYGSDAVGGVVNYILRDNYEGAETLLEVGSATEGDGDQLRISQTLGKGWGSGHGLLSYEYRDEDPVLAQDRDFTINVPDDSFFLPEQRLHSVFGSLDQALTGRLSLNLTGSYSERETRRDFIGNTFPLLVRADAASESTNASAELNFDLTSNWRLQLSGSHSVTKGTVFDNQLGGVGLITDDSTRDEMQEWGMKLDGDALQLPGGALKFAAGAQMRSESHDIGFAGGSRASERDVNAVFAEILLPLISPANRRPGIERLEISAAGRYEDYDSFGSTVDPKIGALWGVLPGLALRATYDTSFRAPLLDESLGVYAAAYYPAAIVFADPAQAQGFPLFLSGYDPGLVPETSTTWTAGVEIQPEPLPGLSLELNYYSTEFSERIATPLVGTSAVIGNPVFDSIVTFNPPVALVQSLIDEAVLVADFSGPGFTNGGRVPADVTVILDGRISNTAITKTDGLDLAVDYKFPLEVQQLSLSASVTRILSFENQFAPAAPPDDVLDTTFNPIGLRARTGLNWAHGGYSANLFLNYTDSYRDARFTPARAVDSFTTADLTLAYSFGAADGDSLFGGLRIALNVLNLFDTDPPALGLAARDTRHVGYDPVNATGRGRFIAVHLRGSWGR